jgi:hypothetical protein
MNNSKNLNVAKAPQVKVATERHIQKTELETLCSTLGDNQI